MADRRAGWELHTGTTPLVLLILLAGLEAVPGHLYEAARTDGTSRWRQFRAITLPLLKPVLTTTFLTIPREIEEAAAIDGCSAWQTLWRVTLRLAVPGLVVAGLLSWLFSWEEFVPASYLTLGAKTMPLQVYYYPYQGNWFLTAACAAAMTAPVLLLAGLLQGYLCGTSMAGAIR